MSFKAKIGLIFFLPWKTLRTNNWFQIETHFIYFWDMEVPIWRMTCLSPQILLHRKSPPITMAASEIVFFFLTQFEPKAGKDYIFTKTLGSCLNCYLCFPFEKAFPLFSVSTFATKIFPLGFDLCTFLLFFFSMLVCNHNLHRLKSLM